MDLSEASRSVAILVVVAVIVMLIVVLVLARRLFNAYPIIRDPDTPRSVKLVFWLSLLYTISPIDIALDPILVDDIGVLLAAIGYVNRFGRSRERTGEDDLPVEEAVGEDDKP